MFCHKITNIIAVQEVNCWGRECIFCVYSCYFVCFLKCRTLGEVFHWPPPPKNKTLTGGTIYYAYIANSCTLCSHILWCGHLSNAFFAPLSLLMVLFQSTVCYWVQYASFSWLCTCSMSGGGVKVCCIYLYPGCMCSSTKHMFVTHSSHPSIDFCIVFMLLHARTHFGYVHTLDHHQQNVLTVDS